MPSNIGIIGIGIYIPETKMTAKQIAEATNGVWAESAVIEKLGIKSKPIPSNQASDGTQEMGALAAIAAIKDAKINPNEIDVVLGIGEEWKEYGLTTSALYIQDRIGADKAWGIDVQNRCSTTVAAIEIAKALMLSNDDINTVLLAGGYRNGDFIDYKDSNVSFMFNLGAGGGALILRKNVNKNLILGAHIIGDGSLARTAAVEIGGIAKPFTKDNLEEGKKSLRLLDPVYMKNRLNEVSMKNWYTCIDKAFEKSKISKKIDYLAVLHMKRSAHEAMLKDLGLNSNQSTYLEEYGHIGQIDQIISLKLGLDSGKIIKGTNICMVAAGIGYVWSANVIKWGER
jgi:3-oxoacyl-[acyl-carrier-protein] synthase III